jgi:hypothetical protein
LELEVKMATLQRIPLSETPIAPAISGPCRGLEITVLHTTTEGSLQALKAAAELARGVGADIRLLVPQVVPFPLPLDEPQVSVEFAQRRFRTVAADAGVDTRVDIRLCRDKEQMIRSALPPHSVIVLGGRRGWWPTSEARLAKRLERLGHSVVFANLK